MRAAAASAAPALTLLQQSTWVGDDQVFGIRLGVGPSVAAADHIVVTAYPRLVNRTDFDLAADGRLGQNAGAVWIGQESVADAPRAAAGGVWARVPVDAALTAGDLQTQQAFDPGTQSGVYPLQVQLVGADYTAVGPAISTFLVYSAGQAAFPKLLAALTVPVTADLALSPSLGPAPLPAPAASSLSELSSVLAAHPTVPLTFAVTPLTAASLAAGTAADRATLARLSTLLRGSDELLPALYASVSPASLAASGLADQIAPQLQAGSALLKTTLGVTPDPGTWVLNGPTDDATLQILEGDGLRRLIVADTALSPLPARLVTTTYGRPTHLDDGGGAAVSVFGTDPTLAYRVTHISNPVLAAEQTLAELAMIELETPSLRRGVAISIPGRVQPSLPFLQTLLSGLQDNPFVRPVTATGLLTGVPTQPPPALPASGSTSTATTSSTATPLPPAAPPPVGPAPRAWSSTGSSRGVPARGVPVEECRLEHCRLEQCRVQSGAHPQAAPGVGRPRALLHRPHGPRRRVARSHRPAPRRQVADRSVPPAVTDRPDVGSERTTAGRGDRFHGEDRPGSRGNGPAPR